MALPSNFVRLIFVSFLLVIVALKDSDVVYAQTTKLTEETDKEALFVFKSGVSETSRVVLDSWNDSLPLCRWTGVKCGNEHKRVTSLDLGGLELTGVVSPFLGNLSFLRSLNLSYNSFRGVIPQEVGNLFRLQYLNMSNNFLEGLIPVVLSNCSSLSTLDLSSNNLELGVPSELGSLSKLILLSLGSNNLTGKFPATLGNLTSLQKLDFKYNQIEGEIPGSIARLEQLVLFNIKVNKFTGVFPPPIYNMSSLIVLSITSNRFSGSLRSDFGSFFPNLQRLIMGNNSLKGTIPDTISNISTLRYLDIPSNHFTGNIPLSFGKLRNLLTLGLGNNSLGNYSSGDLDFLGALTNCTQLQYLDVAFNKIGGQLPAAIANLSTLTELSLEGNFISGSIPHGLRNLVSLQILVVGKNMLTGKLPPTFGELSGLRVIDLNSNGLSGEIPASLGNISWLLYLYLNNNIFEGSIPSSLGNCSNLLKLNLSNNKLNGIIPHELMELPSLLILNVSFNSLVGPLGEDIGNPKHLSTLDVSYNKLSGQIPHTLANCLSLEYLYLGGNSFVGPIPDIRGLTNLLFLDLSNNNLSGTIPEYMTNFSRLLYLNLSGNNFQGAVPTEGIFRNAGAFLVDSSINLCGGIPSLHLEPCSVELPRRHSSLKKIITICVIAGIVTPLLLYLVVVYLCRYKQRKKSVRAQSNNNGNDPLYEKISYDEIYKTTDGFSSSNWIGSGNFGDVFKGFVGDINKAVAIKVLNLHKHGAAKSFVAECEALRGVRHCNLVKLVTVCSSADYKGNDFRALVYEFMPNGNLDTWLHPNKVEEIRRPSRTLTLFERLNISIDVASVLDYLHVQCHDPIAHCDLKPSNVLLDDDLIAHVSDFGLAHLLLKFDQDSFLNQLSSAGVRGTIGYVAPEYGMGGQPSIHGDVYSFGVLLLEMFTGKRPTNELFGGNFTLYSYTKSALREQVLDIADESILHSGLRVGFPIVECLKQVLEIGLMCSEESPTNRPAMSEVVKELFSMRERFFKTRRTARR